MVLPSVPRPDRLWWVPSPGVFFGARTGKESPPGPRPGGGFVLTSLFSLWGNDSGSTIDLGEGRTLLRRDQGAKCLRVPLVVPDYFFIEVPLPGRASRVQFGPHYLPRLIGDRPKILAAKCVPRVGNTVRSKVGTSDSSTFYFFHATISRIYIF